LFEGLDTGRIKRRWQAALGRLNGNKTRGGFLGAPPSGATCMLGGQGANDVLSRSQQCGGLDHAEVDERLDGFRR
jgi:hypothetical protein